MSNTNYLNHLNQSNQSNYSDSSDSSGDDWRISEKRKLHFYSSGSESQRKFPQRHIVRQIFKKDQKRENHKKMLCTRVLSNGKCEYSFKCLYAHSLEEQNVDLPRKKILDILKLDDLSWLDLRVEKEIYKNLMILTKMCDKCAKNDCTGGYNCKYGACIPEILICYDDLNYGKCNFYGDGQSGTRCKHIHLTDKGLKPYHVSFKSNRFSEDDKFFQNKHSPKQISGTLLTEDFFLHLTNNSSSNNSDKIDINVIDDCGDEDDIDCEKSIFTDKFAKLLEM